VKQYHCVFTYSNGHTSIDITADDAQRAAKLARDMLPGTDAKSLEVFDASVLVLKADPRDGPRGR
jgi:hypothetical protein